MHGSNDLRRFFTVACAFTWAFAAPLAIAWLLRREPPPLAVACAGLSAFGPLVAALVSPGNKRDLFGRAPIEPSWILLALVTPAAIHAVARVSFVALGGDLPRWLDLPEGPERVAALVVFPLGEEIGWRGYAHPRAVARWGPVRGSVVVGLVWGLWHLVYSVTPAGIEGWTFLVMMIELPLYAIVVAWVFERSKRSLLAAIAFHAGAHLDHLELSRDMRLHAVHLVVVAVVAALAARSLRAASST